MVDKKRLEYYHKGLIWRVLSRKLGIDRLYHINSKDGNFLDIKPEDNTFKGDTDISDILTVASEWRS